jgi:hypothetical protein
MSNDLEFPCNCLLIVLCLLTNCISDPTLNNEQSIFRNIFKKTSKLKRITQ